MLLSLLSQPFDLYLLLQVMAIVIGVFSAITVHEFAHAMAARTFGDHTAESMGRLTLNPLAHYDPIGSTAMLLFGWGWAKPVPINEGLMRNPRLHGLLSALAGPAMNITCAVTFGLILRFVPGVPENLGVLIYFVMFLNLWLAFFNLLPLPPLDGSYIVRYFLTPRAAASYDRFAHQWGFLLLLGILFLLPAGRILGGFISSVAALIVGVPLS
jgi:Zn-dependent protease